MLVNYYSRSDDFPRNLIKSLGIQLGALCALCGNSIIQARYRHAGRNHAPHSIPITAPRPAVRDRGIFVLLSLDRIRPTWPYPAIKRRQVVVPHPRGKPVPSEFWIMYTLRFVSLSALSDCYVPTQTSIAVGTISPRPRPAIYARPCGSRSPCSL